MNEDDNEQLGFFHAVVAGTALVVFAALIVGGVVLLATVLSAFQLCC